MEGCGVNGFEFLLPELKRNGKTNGYSFVHLRVELDKESFAIS
jgi:hypothetical protein